MDVLEYCQSHHMSDEENDLDLHIRRCRYCRKAMCETCFDVHKNHCSGQAQSSKRKENVSYSSSAGPTVKKCKVSTNSKQSSASISSPLESLSSNLMQGTLQAFPQCAVHLSLQDQFCVSHCKLVCKTCQTDNHKTCTVKSVSEVCGDLDHTTVTQYKTWLNNLRVSGIELKTRLGRNLENAEKQKIKALNDLQSCFTKANKNLNNAYLNVKSEIETHSNSYFTETRENIEKLDGINDTLESSLKDSGTIEGYRMNTKLLLKLLDTISRHNIHRLPVELNTLSSDIKKVNYTFVANMRYQPLSSRSNIGQINTIITKMTPIKHATVADLSHIFSKVSNNENPHAGTGTDTHSLNGATSNQKTMKADETYETVPVIKDSWETYSDTVRKDFTAKATGQYVIGYKRNINYQHKCGTKDDDTHINVNGNQTVNATTGNMMQLSGELRTEHENRDKIVCGSTSTQQYTLTTNKDMKDPASQNKNNVVLLHGSPYVLVPYKPLKAQSGKDYVTNSDMNKRGSRFLPCNSIPVKGNLFGFNKEANSSDQVSNTDNYSPHQSSQSLEQSKSDAQIDQPGHTVAQTLSEMTIGNADSEKLDSYVDTLTMKTGDNGLKSKSIKNICGQPRIETVTTDASVNKIRPAPLTTGLSYLQDSIVCDNGAQVDRGNIINQISQVPLDANLKVMSSESNYMPSTFPPTEISKQEEYNNLNALLQAATMVAYSSQATERSSDMNLKRNNNANNTIDTQLHTIKTKTDNDMPQNIITYNTIVSPLHTVGTVAATNLQMESYINDSNLNCLPNMDNVAAEDLSKKHYTNRNAGVLNDVWDSTAQNETSKTGVATHDLNQYRMLSNKQVENSENNSLTRTFSKTPSLEYVHCAQTCTVNEAMISNNNPLVTTTLPVSDMTLTNVENSATATTPMMDPIKKKHNNKLVFTGLNVKSVSTKYIRMSSDGKEPWISGCIVMPDDRVILCDRQNDNLKLLDRLFTIQHSLDLPCKPYDISAVDDTTAIITLPKMKQLQFIEVTDRMALGRVIQLDLECYGIHCVGSSIYVTCFNPIIGRDCEIRILDLDANVRKRLNLNRDKTYIFIRPDYINVSARTKRIYVSDWGQHTVTCMDQDGTVVYQYKDPKLRGPMGLCVDEEDNVIVCGKWFNNIHIVTAAGERSSIILTGNDGIKYPYSVAYRRSDNTLIVGCWDNENLYVIQFSET